MTSRRALLGAAGAAAIASLLPRAARSSGRAPYGGRIALRIPWPLGGIDPHRIDDVAAACFGEALFDTLYARSEAHDETPSEGAAFRAALAEGDPEPVGNKLRVRLRGGVRFASGLKLGAEAARASIERARQEGAAAWLADVPPPRVDDDALVFSTRDARLLVRALASPLVAIVPPHFSPDRPDGSGPFRAVLRPGGLALTRNTVASNGPSFLDAIDVAEAPDLAASLRAFERGADDLGWLGSFLHEPRAGARNFDGGAIAWAILRTGREAGPLDAPAAAQSLANGVRFAALQSLVVGPAWEATVASWSEPPCDRLVRDHAPWLLEVARSVAAALSAPAHEVSARPTAPAEIAQRRRTRAFTLMLDVARPAGPGDGGALLGLAMADDPDSAIALARHPPRAAFAPRTVTRTMRIGVVAEIRLQGGRAPDVVLPSSPWGRGIDWGSAFRARS